MDTAGADDRGLMSQHRDGSDRPNPHSLWQAVTNRSWPPGDIARTLRDAPADQQIDVIARIVFADDGEQHLPGLATRWTRQHVCVSISDPRLQVQFVWLNPADVRRRGEQDPA